MEIFVVIVEGYLSLKLNFSKKLYCFIFHTFIYLFTGIVNKYKTPRVVSQSVITDISTNYTI